MSDVLPKRNKNVLIAGLCGVFVAAMVGAAYAAVPLYNWFCRTTGFGGTPQIATAEPSQVLGRKLVNPPKFRCRLPIQ